MKYFIFFDIDNTILSNNKKLIHPQTIKLLETLHKNSNVVLGIATGRGPGRLEELDSILHLFDVKVLGNGSYIELKNQVFYNNKFEHSQLKEILDICIQYEVLLGGSDEKEGFLLNEPYYGKTIRKEVLKKIENIGEVYHLWLASDRIDDVIKCKKVLEKNFDCFYWTAQKGLDIVHKNDSKYQGILRVIKSYNFSEHKLICVGDGHNDLEMVKNADLGIAMENTTCLELKIVADYIAPLIDNDEMFDFFKKLKLDINYFE